MTTLLLVSIAASHVVMWRTWSTFAFIECKCEQRHLFYRALERNALVYE